MSRKLFLILPVLITLVAAEETDKFLVNTKGCKIERWNPHDPEIMKIYDIKPYSDCRWDEEITRINFNSTTSRYILSIKNVSRYSSGIQCSYEEIIRLTENSISYGNRIDFNNQIVIPETVEHIYVSCRVEGLPIYYNCYYMVQRKRKTDVSGRSRPSIIIIGMDSVSRSGFIRTMPGTWSYMQSSKRWFNLAGYTRVSL